MASIVFLLGASGFVGSEVLRRLLDRGHSVRVLLRDRARLPALADLSRVEVVVGDLSNETALAEGMQGAAAVLSTIGFVRRDGAKAPPPSEGLPRLFALMRRAGISRYVCLSGAAVPFPGDDLGVLDRAFAAFVRRMEGENASDKAKEREVILGSSLAWTVLRPGKIIDSGPTERLRVSLVRPPGWRITRGDVAVCLVEQLTDESYVRKAPFIASAR